MRGLTEKCNVVMARINVTLHPNKKSSNGIRANYILVQAIAAVRLLAADDARLGNVSLPYAFVGDAELTRVWAVTYSDVALKYAESKAVDELRERFVQANGVSSLKELLSVPYDGPEISGKE